jgi:hypothetical protein
VSPPIPAPPISADLVKWLDSLFPQRCADPADTDRTIWIKSGQRSVVDRIIHEMERQSKGPLPSVLRIQAQET